MNLDTATNRIETALSTLEKSIGEPVFDEWALVEKSRNGLKLVEYRGSRKETFLSEFKNDIAALRGTLDPEQIHVGDFAFSHEGYGSGFDAYMCVGKELLILFNNTEKSTGEITNTPKWTVAQVHFTELLETFIADPLEI